MKKPSKPTEPKAPTPPSQTVGSFAVHGLIERYDQTLAKPEVSYPFDEGFEDMSFTPETFMHVADGLKAFLEAPPENLITETVRVRLASYEAYVSYEVAVPNPNYAEQMRKHEIALQTYEVKMETYRRLLADYERDMAAWQDHRLKAARETLRRYEENVKKRQTE